MNELRDHLRLLREGTVDPADYNSKGYALRGSIRTDGFRLQLISFKLRVLQRCRFNRPGNYPSPPRLISTVAGTDYFLTEIRNIAKTPADVSRLWPNCKPDEIKILCLDLGQAFVAGASAMLPNSSVSQSITLSSSVPAISSSIPTELAFLDTPLMSSNINQVFHNIAVSQKAVAQPILKHRRWMEAVKGNVPDYAEHSIADIESRMPPLRGKDASVIEYFQELEQAQDHLDAFYNGNNLLYKRHLWDAKRAKKEEFRTVANRLLNAIGGSVGRQRAQEDNVVIGIGLGQFKSSSGLTSLHETFLAYFVNLSFIHRDIMAAHNMCNIVRSYLVENIRPDYLQPVDDKGNMPWKKDGDGIGIAPTHESRSSSSSSSSSSFPSRKTRMTKKPPGQDFSPAASRMSKRPVSVGHSKSIKKAKSDPDNSARNPVTLLLD
ncbi:hypothetical protein BGZ80_000400 [Entomortierella chlamydospora]|uniref:Uncharacterized protein n=1 Tax=Entomortierella chlamydospora TaxID=101097 RepID=A0A9P6MSG2_9FUNG|nr:hypothetical protein BGZ80_000400 [Entomortierella chlamydospora]